MLETKMSDIKFIIKQNQRYEKKKSHNLPLTTIDYYNYELSLRVFKN